MAKDDEPLAAGPFGAWLGELGRALRSEGDTDVPCGTCTACCRSAQFIHIGPDELDTLAHIPRALLFPAPRMPKGHVLLGYDEQGRCPMLREDGCSIYRHRPRTCRTYDCRVFAATGIDVGADDPSKTSIARRAGRWEFSFETPEARTRHEAVQAAVQFLLRHRDALPAGAVPNAPTALAVVAIELHDRFLRATPVEHGGAAPGAELVVCEPDIATVSAALESL